MLTFLIYTGALLLLFFVLVAWRMNYLLRKFTCGSTIDDVLCVAGEYNQKGIRVLINFALEDVGGNRRVSATSVYHGLIRRMDEKDIDGDISVKPSSLVVSSASCGEKIKQFRHALYDLLGSIEQSSHERWLWLDEERTADLEWVDPVLENLVMQQKQKRLAIRVRAYLRATDIRIGRFMRWIYRGAQIKIGVCRGTYKGDQELDDTCTEIKLLDILDFCRRHKVETVACTHTLVRRVLNDARLGHFGKPTIHMLHGRKEVEDLLIPLAKEGKLEEAAVYLIFGPFWHKAKYGWRRIMERPSLLLWS